jgi:hypothetical protein
MAGSTLTVSLTSKAGSLIAFPLSGVFEGIKVSSQAMGVESGGLKPSSTILLVRDQLYMRGVDALSDAAKMVTFEMARNRIDQPFVG